MKLGRAQLEVSSIYGVAALAACLVYVVGAFALALALPYHDWDAFSLGAWSISISHGHLDPILGGSGGAARPLFFWLQGALWSLTGVSFVAGRLVGLVFAGVLLVSIWLFVRAETAARLDSALSVLVILAIPAYTQEAIAGKTDVPAAAAVAVVAWLAVRNPRERRGLVVVALAALIAVLVKQTAFVPLGALALVLACRVRPWQRRTVPLVPLAIAAGLAVGLVYELVMALRFHLSLLAYLRSGTTDGFYAQLAASERWHAVLRADVLGEALRVPLTFAVLYALMRVVGLRHQVAAFTAIPLALLWSIGGPYLAHVPNGPFGTAESGFTLVGFGLAILATVGVQDEQAPSRATLALGLFVGLPPLLIWAYSVPYADRLASASWPGLALLVAVVLATAVRGLLRLGVPAGLAPIPVVALAIWMSLAGIDGLHGYDWVELRQHGVGGLWNRAETMNVVLPSVQSALEAVTPVIGTGALVTDDPSFQYFLPPGHVRTMFALHCSDLVGSRAFIFLTSDEVKYAANSLGGLETPEQWSRCTHPHLRQLTDGSDGYVVFAVGS